MKMIASTNWIPGGNYEQTTIASIEKGVDVHPVCPSVNWQKLLISLVLWLIAEICLNCVGLDDLADCSEFLLDRHAAIVLTAEPSSWV